VVAWLYWPVSGYTLPDGVTSSRPDIVARGEQLTREAGCISCHWNEEQGGARFAGGRALKSPFGTFYATNITPDSETGIGSWSDEDFVAAMKLGRRPDGSNLYPAFPYTSYAKMPVEDVLAIKAFLFAQPAIRQENKPHDVGFPFDQRALLTGWKLLFFDNTTFAPDPSRDAAINRGAYLVEVLGHCGECHTPRNFLGGTVDSRKLGGAPAPVRSPNITFDRETGIGIWSKTELVHFFRTGQKPDFDNAQGEMVEVIEHSLSQMTDEDLASIVAYLQSIPSLRQEEGAR
jgi:mono/diheme cytochrome c family protein